MRFWSLRPAPGNSTVTLQPSCLPAASAPDFAMVQKSATPLETNATCAGLRGDFARSAMRACCAATRSCAGAPAVPAATEARSSAEIRP